MRLLDRYLLRELAAPFGYCLSGFAIFWITFDLFAQLGGFQRQRLSPLEVATYYVITLPELLVLIVPIGLLLALLYALTNHARHHELTAMRAAGVSLARISVPYLLVGFLLSIGLALLNELWVPQSNDAAQRLLNRHVVNPKANKEFERQLGFYNFRGKRQWFIQEYNLLTDEMIQPHVFWKTDGIRHEVSAGRAAWVNGFWVFTNAQELIFTKQIQPTRIDARVRVMRELSETPAQIKAQIKVGKLQTRRSASKTQLSIREILDYKKWNPGSARNQALLDTKLHNRLAEPWTCLVVVLIALPFGAATGRRNVFVGVASSIVICFAYFVMQQLSLAVGAGGFIPAIVAAWAPNLLFTAAALILIRRVR